MKSRSFVPHQLVWLLFLVLLARTDNTVMSFSSSSSSRRRLLLLCKPHFYCSWCHRNARFSFSSLSLTSNKNDDSFEIATPENNDNDSLSTTTTSSKRQRRQQQRQGLLDDKLGALGIDTTSLYKAVQVSMTDPTAGYDGKFGRSAIKCYRSFIYPKEKNNVIDHNDDAQLVEGMASRTAQQIDFLLKRHASHQQEWVRHSDSIPNTTSNDRTTVFPAMLLLDNVRSAFNVGSIFRTADACGAKAVITTGITPHPTGNGSEKVAKSALGADRVIPSRHFGTTADAIAWIRQEHANYQLLGLETTNKSRCYTDMVYPTTGVVIVLGNEVTGLDTNVMPLLDDLIEIPMFGTKNSLNVASCAPIVLYEVIRQWNK